MGVIVAGGGGGDGVVKTESVGVGATAVIKAAVVAGGGIGVGVASISVLQATTSKIMLNKNHKGINFFMLPIFATANTLVKTA